jgi:hypothetical protein
MSLCLAIGEAMDRPKVNEFRQAAAQAGEERFVELLRWYRAVDGLPDKEWGAAGSYSSGIDELPDQHARALLADLRRLSRNRRHRRRPLDGKPTFAGGRTLSQMTVERRGKRGG